MRTTSLIAIAAGLTISFTACKKEQGPDPTPVGPNGTQLTSFFNGNVEDNTQHFTVNASTGGVITGSHGTTVYIYGGTLQDGSGNPITGNVDVEMVEIYDRASMILMNKPTMGILPNGDKSTLLSKGEYYLKITQNGNPVNANNGVYVMVPSNNIAGSNSGMSLFDGTIELGNLAWNLVQDSIPLVADSANGQGTMSFQILEGTWGWTNVDRFYSDPRPKTVLKAQLPEGYDNTNCEVYIAYDGEPGALASLDTYTNDGYFSEHYGLIPIGLEVHFIAVTVINGQLHYAIQGATIEAGHIEQITNFTAITQSELAALINALP